MTEAKEVFSMNSRPTNEELSEKISERDKDVEELLEFIRLLADLSKIFIKAMAGEIDEKVEEVLQHIGEILGIDRTEFVQENEETGQLEITHSWNVRGIEPYPTLMTGEDYPWITEKIRSSEKPILFRSIDDIPKKAVRDRETLQKMGIKSGLIIPYAIEGAFLGAIAFGSHKKNKIFGDDAHIHRLRLLGEVIFNALRRKQADFELQERHEERLRFEQLLTELSSSFINIPAGEIDEKVESLMRYICEMLEIDRAIFWQFSSESGEFVAFHSWTAKGVQPMPRIVARELYPWMTEKVRKAEGHFIFRVDQLPKEAAKDKESYKKVGVKSGLIIPYSIGGEVGAIAFTINRFYKSEWPEEHIQRLRLLGEVMVNALRRKQADLEVQNAFSEIKQLKDQLQKENVYLREEIKAIQKHEEIIGESDAMLGVLNAIEEVAETDATVLIFGETGTGKELVARAIHNMSKRKNRSMVTVNCAALPATLIESELFGREKGAYTGAMTKQAGRFETADGSTLFLDEIGDLPMELQAKLLRVLQDGQFERLGSSKTIRVDVRLITATNRNLEKAVREGNFREDLYYRLNVFPIKVPPLRERPEDILPLIWHFAKEFGESMGKRIEMIPRKNLEAIQSYSWPGNIRELRNVVERAVITSKGKSLIVNIPRSPDASPGRDLPLEEYERRYILDILEKTGWRISGKRGAAEILDLKRTTLLSRMKKLGIQRSNTPIR
jgi:formate hydrogenlyase transcriptional activator